MSLYILEVNIQYKCHSVFFCFIHSVPLHKFFETFQFFQAFSVCMGCWKYVACTLSLKSPINMLQWTPCVGSCLSRNLCKAMSVFLVQMRRDKIRRNWQNFCGALTKSLWHEIFLDICVIRSRTKGEEGKLIHQWSPCKSLPSFKWLNSIVLV